MEINSNFIATPCPHCGITGLHACPGRVLAPYSPAEEEALDRALAEVFGMTKPRKAKYSDCQHSHCSECKGTGVKANGQQCIHMLNCFCDKCYGVVLK